MAVNFVSSPPPSSSVSATAVQTVQKTASKRTRAGNGSFSASDLLDDGEGGRLLKDLVAVLASSRKQEVVNKGTSRSAICKSPDLMLEKKCGPPDRVHRLTAIASLNAATKEFSALAEKIIAIADSGNSSSTTSQQDDDHTNSNNTIVNEKEKTESHIYNNENDDITLDDSKTPSPVQPPPEEGKEEEKRKNREVSIDNNAAAAVTAAVCFSTAPPIVVTGKEAEAARNEVTIRDCIKPRGEGPLLEEKLDKLLDNVVKIKADMHQKIDRLSRRIDQIRLDVQLNIDTTDRAVCNNVLEFVGIPYRKDENLQQYFRQICLLLGYSEADIPLVDIRRKRAAADRRTLDKTESIAVNTAITNNISNTASTARSYRKRRGVEQPESDGGLNSSIVVVEFVFKNIRDAFYRAYLKKRSICLSDIVLDGPLSDRRIYVNETLTRMNQKLKSAALKKKREGVLHAVYTVDGEVFVQQQPGQKGRRINSVAELE